MKNKVCPGCGARLKEVRAEANYSRVLLIDQCVECGGLWFDKWELYFLSDRSVEALEGVDERAFLERVTSRKGSHKCPGCEVELKPFVDANLPPDSSIKRCDSCSGLWLNRGELSSYVAHRRALKEKKGLSKAGVLPALGMETLGKLQKELDTASLTRARVPEPFDDGPIDGNEFAKDVGFLVLQALLRLVFKF